MNNNIYKNYSDDVFLIAKSGEEYKISNEKMSDLFVILDKIGKKLEELKDTKVSGLTLLSKETIDTLKKFLSFDKNNKIPIKSRVSYEKQFIDSLAIIFHGYYNYVDEIKQQMDTIKDFDEFLNKELDVIIKTVKDLDDITNLYSNFMESKYEIQLQRIKEFYNGSIKEIKFVENRNYEIKKTKLNFNQEKERYLLTDHLELNNFENRVSKIIIEEPKFNVSELNNINYEFNGGVIQYNKIINKINTIIQLLIQSNNKLLQMQNGGYSYTAYNEVLEIISNSKPLYTYNYLNRAIILDSIKDINKNVEQKFIKEILINGFNLLLDEYKKPENSNKIIEFRNTIPFFNLYLVMNN